MSQKKMTTLFVILAAPLATYGSMAESRLNEATFLASTDATRFVEQNGITLSEVTYGQDDFTDF